MSPPRRTGPEGERPAGVTYASAGVDVAAGDRAVELMRAYVARTQNAQVVGGLGGFAGLFDASLLRHMRRPLLATSTDGVGTKVAVAQALDIHHTIGFDLVGMVVDDIVVSGARPLFMTDYIACGKVVPERIADIVRGIAAACRQVGCALIGGETAEHPGLLGPQEYDLAGAVTGVVEADDVLGAHRVQVGDAVLALASSGLHSNGYSLVRRVIADAGWSYGRHVDDLGRSLGEELLQPTRVYAADVLSLAGELGPRLHAVSHVTGGGIASNLARVLPRGVQAVLDRATWTPPAIFGLVAALGRVPADDLERTLNMGVGMLVVVPPGAVAEAVRHLQDRSVPTWQAGEVVVRPAGQSQGDTGTIQGAKGVDGGSVRLVNTHPPEPGSAASPPPGRAST